MALALFVTLIAGYLSIGWGLRTRILEGNNDFIASYTAARMVWDGKGAELFNLREQTTYQEAILRSLHTDFRFRDGLLAYIHAPFEIIWFIPLGALSYLQAYCAWFAISLGCIVLGVYLLLQATRRLTPGLLVRCILGSLAFFPVFINLLQGQDSATLFLFWSVGYWNIVRSNERTAGVWWSLLLQKLQVVLPTLLVLTILKRWRALTGFLAGSLALLVASLAVVGRSGLESYVRLLVDVSSWIERKGIYPSQMHNLRAQFYVWLYPDHPGVANLLTGLASVLLLALLLKCWKGEWKPDSARFALKFSLLVTVSLLVSPHLNLHDLSCLLVPGVLIAQISDQDAETQSRLRRLRSGVWLVGYPLMLASMIVSGWVPIQLSVWGMIAIVLLLIQALKGCEVRWKTTPEIMPHRR